MNYATFRKFRLFVYVANIIALVLTLAFIGIFVCYFHGRLSDSLSDWASFGNYFAGTVGVVAVLMNLLDIFYIYIKLGRATHQQYLTTLRSSTYKMIVDELYKVQEDTIGDSGIKNRLKTWLKNTDFDSLLFLRSGQVCLFDNLKTELITTLDSIFPENTNSLQAFMNKKVEMVNALKDVMKETNN